MAEVGVQVTAFLAFWIPLALVTLVTIKAPSVRLGLFGWILIVWATTITIVHVLRMPEVEVAAGQMRSGTLRTLSQIFMFLVFLSPALVIPKLVKSIEDLSRIGEIFVTSVVIVCILGLFQLAVFHLFAVDLFPIGSVTHWLGHEDMQRIRNVESAIREFDSDKVFQITSLGGEPKHFGCSLVLAILMVQGAMICNRHGRYRSRKLFFVWLLLLVGIVLTLSTTAYLLFAMGNVVLFFSRKIFPISYSESSASFRFIPTMTTVSLLLLAAITWTNGPPATGDIGTLDVIYERTFARFEGERVGFFGKAKYGHEEFDTAIIDMLLDNPTYVLTGVGLGHAHLYAVPYQGWDTLVAYVAYRGYLRWISEVGLVGLLLLFLWYGKHFSFGIKLAKHLPLVQRDHLTRVLLASWLVMFVYLASAQDTVRITLLISLGMIISLERMVPANFR